MQWAANPSAFRFGNTTATVPYAGLAGLYQFNVVAPNVLPGDIALAGDRRRCHHFCNFGVGINRLLPGLHRLGVLNDIGMRGNTDALFV